jgi:AcrR family transcriptional regulator
VAIASTAPPLREEHKTRTRQALQEAALKLFATQGYDTTTIDDIAALAGVSTRTFFRYFPTKESVLFVQERRWGESFAQSFVRQPATSSDIEAIRDTLIEIASGQKRGRLRLYERAAASSAALRGQGVEQQRVELELLGTLLAERRGVPWPDEGCRLLAEVGIVTYRRALDRWLATVAGNGLAEIILDEFRLLGRQFASD